MTPQAWGVACVLAYIFVGGFVWACLPAAWDKPHGTDTVGPPIRGLLTTFWPMTLAVFVMYLTAMMTTLKS